jgi:hypothetical protein
MYLDTPSRSPRMASYSTVRNVRPRRALTWYSRRRSPHVCTLPGNQRSAIARTMALSGRPTELTSFGGLDEPVPVAQPGRKGGSSYCSLKGRRPLGQNRGKDGTQPAKPNLFTTSRWPSRLPLCEIRSIRSIEDRGRQYGNRCPMNPMAIAR